MRKPSCITCINTCCLNPSLSWMIPLLTASQNHWRCCSNIWYYIANITIFFPFLIPLTPKDNDTFQWYWRCLWNLNIFQWSFAKWCYDLFIANIVLRRTTICWVLFQMKPFASICHFFARRRLSEFLKLTNYALSTLSAFCPLSIWNEKLNYL